MVRKCTLNGCVEILNRAYTSCYPYYITMRNCTSSTHIAEPLRPMFVGIVFTAEQHCKTKSHVNHDVNLSTVWRNKLPLSPVCNTPHFFQDANLFLPYATIVRLHYAGDVLRRSHPARSPSWKETGVFHFNLLSMQVRECLHVQHSFLLH